MVSVVFEETIKQTYVLFQRKYRVKTMAQKSDVWNTGIHLCIFVTTCKTTKTSCITVMEFYKTWENLVVKTTLINLFLFCLFQIYEDLISSIADHDSKHLSLSPPRILLVGQIGAGKSSFINSVLSVFKNQVVNKVYTDSRQVSVTDTVRNYQCHYF